MAALDDLLRVMERLRNPDTGCPWGRRQTFETIAPYTLEEAYELVDAIESGDREALAEELGDLLLQVVYHAQMAKEAGLFDFEQVAAGIAAKMVERNPHVFGDAVLSEDELPRAWEAAKMRKRRDGDDAIFGGAKHNMPALKTANRLQKAAAHRGFDWPQVDGVVAKLREEMDEVERARDGDGRVDEEIGDLLFTVVNLARHLSVEPESALRHANRKFERRFRKLAEELSSRRKTFDDASLEELDEIWNQVKRSEKSGAGS